MPADSTSKYSLILEGEQLQVSATPRAGFFDPRFLVAALLEHIANGDGEVSDEEAAHMIELVAEHFDLDLSRAEHKFAHALALYSRSMNLAEVGSVLAEILTQQERQDVLVMSLRLIAVDGRQGSDELAALDEVSAALSITAEEKHAAFNRYFAEQASGE